MTVKRIEQIPQASDVSGSDLIPIWQNGRTRIAPVASIIAEFLKVLPPPPTVFTPTDPLGLIPADATLLALVSGSRDVTIPAGNYRVAASMTWPRGKRYYFDPGAVLYPDPSATITIQGEVIAGCYRLFAGLGKVVGLASVRPEWFGAIGDGFTDDQPALQASHDCMAGSSFSSGERAVGLIPRYGAIYGLGRQLNLRPTDIFNMRWVGGGSGFGTRFKALPSFDNTSGAAAIRVFGQSDPSRQVMNFELGAFSIENASGNACGFGLQVGGDPGSGNIQPFASVPISDIVSLGFQVGFKVGLARSLRLNGCSSFNDQVVNGVGLQITCERTTGVANGAFTGDCIFDGCLFNVHRTTGTGISILGSTPGSQISGIRFKAITVSGARQHVEILTGATCIINDIWFEPGCQLDGPVISGYKIIATGGTIENINILNTYNRGFTAGSGIIFQCKGVSGGTVNIIKYNENFVSDGGTTTAGILVDVGCTNIEICRNMIQGLHNSGAAAIYSFSPRVTIAGNRLVKAPDDGSTVAVAHMISINSGLDRVHIYDNDSGGYSTGTKDEIFGTPTNSIYRATV